MIAEAHCGVATTYQVWPATWGQAPLFYIEFGTEWNDSALFKYEDMPARGSARYLGR